MGPWASSWTIGEKTGRRWTQRTSALRRHRGRTIRSLRSRRDRRSLAGELHGLLPDVSRALLANARETRVEAGRVFYRGAYHDQMANPRIGRRRPPAHLPSRRQWTSGDAPLRRTRQHRRRSGAAPRDLNNDSEQARQGWQMLGGLVVLMARRSATPCCCGCRRGNSSGWSAPRSPSCGHSRRSSPAGRWRPSRPSRMNMFLPVQARVARHLIDLASLQDDVLVVTAGHQEIADAIGSVREVVSRALGADVMRASSRDAESDHPDPRCAVAGLGRQAARSS